MSGPECTRVYLSAAICCTILDESKTWHLVDPFPFVYRAKRSVGDAVNIGLYYNTLNSQGPTVCKDPVYGHHLAVQLYHTWNPHCQTLYLLPSVNRSTASWLKGHNNMWLRDDTSISDSDIEYWFRCFWLRPGLHLPLKGKKVNALYFENLINWLKSELAADTNLKWGTEIPY